MDNKCNAWDCSSKFSYDSKNPLQSFLLEYESDGSFSLSRNGIEVPTSSYYPPMNVAYNDYDVLKEFTNEKGAVFCSSQWVGWVVPVGSCSTEVGDIEQSSYTVRNLEIYGDVVRGPPVRLCANCDQHENYNRKTRYSSKGKQVHFQGKVYSTIRNNFKGGLRKNKFSKRKWKVLGKCKDDPIPLVPCSSIDDYDQTAIYDIGNKVVKEMTIYSATNKDVQGGIDSSCN